jgi:hypothetical protein
MMLLIKYRKGVSVYFVASASDSNIGPSLRTRGEIA